MKILLLALLSLISLKSSASQTEEAIAMATIKALFPTLTASRNSKTNLVEAGACNFQKNKWGTIILTKQSFVEKIQFNKMCDLQGEFRVEVDKYFPINLQIKKLTGYTRLISNIKLSIVFEQMPVLKIEMKDSILRGTKNITFNMNYAVYIDPLAKNPLKKHKGGYLFLKKHGTKKINKKIKLNFSKK